MGHFGWWIVVLVTFAAVFLEMGGLILWWKRKAISVRVRSGWRLALFDLHHTIGILALPMMLLLAVTGVATLWMAIAADMGASLLVIFNGLRLMKQ